MRYEWENGRRYHSDAVNDKRYWLEFHAEVERPSANDHRFGRGPNDETQQVAEDLAYVLPA